MPYIRRELKPCKLAAERVISDDLEEDPCPLDKFPHSCLPPAGLPVCRAQVDAAAGSHNSWLANHRHYCYWKVAATTPANEISGRAGMKYRSTADRHAIKRSSPHMHNGRKQAATADRLRVAAQPNRNGVYSKILFR